MSPGGSLWLKTALGTTAALALLLALDPALPARGLPWSAALLLGASAGAAVALAVTRRSPRRPLAPSSLPTLLAKLAFFGLWAANEEIIWRRVVLGELLPLGGLTALALSSGGFAFLHGARRLHLATGTAFGAVYLATGALVAAIAAHWLYNAMLAVSLEPRAGNRGLHRPDGAPP